MQTKSAVKKEIETFRPTSKQAWRRWLKQNHRSAESVWLILYKKEANKPTISWSDAVDEALCFGWVDSKRKPFDEEKFLQFFAKRKPRGTWSKINKEKIERLIAAELMTTEGLKTIEAAKQNGSWTMLDEVEKLIIPKDLTKEFKAWPGSKAFYLSLSKSVRKAILQWLVLAKQQGTRQRRISEIAELASQELRPKQFR